VVYMIFGVMANPIPDPRDASWEQALRYENYLEGMAVWIAFCMPFGRRVSNVSIGKYVSSVRSWYRRFHRGKLGLGAEGSRIQDILKGYARLVDQPPPMERHGCAPEALARGRAMVMAAMDEFHALMWEAALDFGMLALARGCEFAIDEQREKFDEEQHMTALDVTMGENEGTPYYHAKMRKRKDLRVLRGKHADVYIAGAKQGAPRPFLDAVQSMRRWLAARRARGVAENRPLFCHGDGRAITVAQVREMVRKCMAAAGLDPAHYGAHSLRIGGATAALAAGVSPSLIRLMGRWSSDIYEIYCRMTLQSALGVGSSISSAMVSAATPAFKHEELELMPQEMDEAKRIWDAWGVDGDGDEA